MTVIFHWKSPKNIARMLLLNGTVVLSLFLFPLTPFAADLFLKDLTSQEFKNVIGDFSAVLVHTPLTSASGSTLFGIEFGLIAGTVNTINLQQVVAGVAPSENIATMPHAGLFASLAVPFGLTGELIHLPAYDAEGVRFRNSSLALKWTLTQTLLQWPVDFALRFHSTESNFESSQASTVPGLDVRLNFEDTISGIQALVSKNFLIIEPYAGFGFLRADANLTLTGTTGDSLFEPSLGLANSSNETIMGTQIFLGVYFNLLVFKFAVEAGRIFKTDKVSAKLAFGF